MLKLHTAPAAQAVSTAEAKLHLRVDVADDDALIAALIGSATLDAEHLMGRAIMPQKWLLTLDSFPGAIILQRPTITAVDNIKYVDSTGTLQTLAPEAYQLAAASDYTASITPAYAQAWPVTRVQPEAVQVIFSAGYADVAAVPESIKAWIKLRVGALYENRSSVVMERGMVSAELSIADSLLDRYRVWSM